MELIPEIYSPVPASELSVSPEEEEEEEEEEERQILGRHFLGLGSLSKTSLQ